MTQEPYFLKFSILYLSYSLTFVSAVVSSQKLIKFKSYLNLKSENILFQLFQVNFPDERELAPSLSTGLHVLSSCEIVKLI